MVSYRREYIPRCYGIGFPFPHATSERMVTLTSGFLKSNKYDVVAKKNKKNHAWYSKQNIFS
jgi:hypothetical protein